jgi:hypothetical protein
MAMLLADALPIGIIGAVLQATRALVAARARARGMNRKLVMKDSWLVDKRGKRKCVLWRKTPTAGVPFKLAFLRLGTKAN